MRPDMYKVIVETRRPGGRMQGEARKFRNSEEAPARLSMRSSYRARKGMRDKLRPLYRFLRSQAGRPWDKVYAEICETVDVRSTVQQHLRLHADQFVVLDATIEGGEIYTNTRYGRVALGPGELFVHPRTRLLLEKKARVRQSANRRLAAAQPTDRRIVDGQHQLHRIGGTWYLVELARLPQPPTVAAVATAHAGLRKRAEPRWDAVLKVTIRGQHTGGEALYGHRELYAVSKRQLSGRELRHYGLHNGLPEDGDLH